MKRLTRPTPARTTEEEPTPETFTPRHCDCLPCRHGLAEQHVRRTDQLVIAR